jgi:hypothetical protein
MKRLAQRTEKVVAIRLRGPEIAEFEALFRKLVPLVPKGERIHWGSVVKAAMRRACE